MPVSEVTTHHRPKKFHENSFIMDCVNHLKQMSSYNTIILWYLKIELRFLGQDPCFWSLFKSSFQVQVKLTNKQSRKKKKYWIGTQFCLVACPSSEKSLSLSTQAVMHIHGMILSVLLALHARLVSSKGPIWLLVDDED